MQNEHHFYGSNGQRGGITAETLEAAPDATIAAQVTVEELRKTLADLVGKETATEIKHLIYSMNPTRETEIAMLQYHIAKIAEQQTADDLAAAMKAQDEVTTSNGYTVEQQEAANWQELVVETHHKAIRRSRQPEHAAECAANIAARHDLNDLPHSLYPNAYESKQNS